jgi:VWFA-related protein
MLALMLSAVLAAPQLQETITVTRVLADVRVTNDDGDPITDLTAADFEARIAGKKAVIESVEWIADTASERLIQNAIAEEPASEAPDAPVQPEGRLIVLFMQTDFARNMLRTEGQLKFLHFAEEMVDSFEPEDRLAVFSFDSHLKFRLDFTSDKEKVRDALRGGIYIDEPPVPPIVPSPALFSRLNRDEMKRAASSETALHLIGNALRPIPGPKSLILLGWGLGHRTPIGLRMEKEWAPALYVLDAARVSIFALDTTNADYHDLEVGLQTAAAQTGGFYAKTHLFPQIAVKRLQRALAGHYEIELRPEGELALGSQTLDLRVKRRGLTVLAPSSVWIKR